MDTSNVPTKVSEASESPLGQELLRFLRYWLSDRRVMIGIAATVITAGAALNWGWLVAIGVAPILLAVLPCAAMCALGLCAMGKGKGNAACGKGATSDETSDHDVPASAGRAAKRDRIASSE